MKKHAWDNIYVIIAGIVLLSVILIGSFTSIITKSSNEDLANIQITKSSNEDLANIQIADSFHESVKITGNYYEPGTGIRGFLNSSDDSYIIALGDTIIAREQTRINEFAGVYKITKSRFLSEDDFNNTKDIIMIGKEDSTDPILDNTKSIRNNQDDESIVILNEEKRQLIVLGGSPEALIYTIELLKTLECKEFNNAIVITKIGAGCQIYVQQQEPVILPAGGGGSGYAGGVEIINNTKNNSYSVSQDSQNTQQAGYNNINSSTGSANNALPDIMNNISAETDSANTANESQTPATAFPVQPNYFQYLIILLIIILLVLLIAVFLYKRKKKK